MAHLRSDSQSHPARSCFMIDRDISEFRSTAIDKRCVTRRLDGVRQTRKFTRDRHDNIRKRVFVRSIRAILSFGPTIRKSTFLLGEF